MTPPLVLVWLVGLAVGAGLSAYVSYSFRRRLDVPRRPHHAAHALIFSASVLAAILLSGYIFRMESLREYDNQPNRLSFILLWGIPLLATVLVWLPRLVRSQRSRVDPPSYHAGDAPTGRGFLLMLRLSVLSFLLLGLGMIGLALRTWWLHPERWAAAIAGLLFFGVCTAVLIVLGRREWHGLPATCDPATTVALLMGVCSLVIALAGALLVVSDYTAVGALGSAVCFATGVVLLVMARRLRQIQAGDGR